MVDRLNVQKIIENELSGLYPNDVTYTVGTEEIDWIDIHVESIRVYFKINESFISLYDFTVMINDNELSFKKDNSYFSFLFENIYNFEMEVYDKDGISKKFNTSN